MDFQRYKRNIAIEQIGEEGQKRLLSSKVLIAGAGGLGSNVIASLAGVGVGTLGIIDFDDVEISNLNRQFVHKHENIKASKVLSAKVWVENYNPDINVCTYNQKIEESTDSMLFHDYDIVVDCLDSYESKFLLNKLCIENNKILVHAGVTGFQGQVTTIVPKKTACLSCLFDDFDSSLPEGNISPMVSIIGSIQALEVIKILLGFDDKLENILLIYNGLKNNFSKINISQNPSCKICKQKALM